MFKRFIMLYYTTAKEVFVATSRIPTSTARKVPPLQRKNTLFSYLFLSPYLLVLLLFGLIPALYSIIISFQDTTSDNHFVGLANYLSTFQDYRFVPAFEDVLFYVLLWLPIMTVGTVVLALLLHARANRLSSLIRLIYYLPGAVTGSVNVLLWIFMLDPQISPFGVVLRLLGMQTSASFVNFNLALIFAIMAFATGAGSWIVVMYGAFENISAEVTEAAKIDGCNIVQASWYIKLPMISRYVIYSVILSFTAGLQIYVEPAFLGQAGLPVSPTPWSINQLALTYVSKLGNYGAAAAISMWLFVVSLIAALFIIFKTKFFQIDVNEG